MYKDDVRITFKHWKNENLITLTGILPEMYNPEQSDYYVLLKSDGALEDIRKESVVELEFIK